MKIKTPQGLADLYELTVEETVFFRKAYRTLRIRVPAQPPNVDVPLGQRHSGMFYGMRRDEAKATILPLAKELNWYGYLGTK